MSATTAEFAPKSSTASRLFVAARARLAALCAGAVHARYGAPPPESDEISAESDEDMRVAVALICAAHF